MPNVKVGFIGCGSHATHNLYPMLKYAAVDLQAVCDLDRNLAERNARLFGAAAVYDDFEAMLDAEELEGVFVVGPPDLHYTAGKAVLKRGLGLFTEKPPASDLEKTRELVELAAGQDARFMVGFMKRHGMTYAKVRAMITGGGFDPAMGAFQYGHWETADLRRMLLTMCIHPIDLAVSYFGPAASVSSALYRSGRTLSLGLTLRFRNDRIAQLMLDGSQPRIQERAVISGTYHGQNAMFVIDNVDRIEFHKQGLNGIDLLAPDLPAIEPLFDLEDIRIWRPDNGLPNMGQSRHFFQGFAGEVREFACAVREKRDPYPSGRDALEAMRIIEAVAARPDGTTEL